jgi:CheY-like chemotaxis protein/transcriptional regulator with GAF, ATPase, and Fis domain
MATILVVDDHAINRKLLIALLSGDGHLTVEAVDGIDGLQVARTHRPQLIISDILMPSMDGYGFVRALRLDPELQATPVIFYTAHYHEREAHTLAQACGVNRVLVKPCPHAELLKVVEQTLAGVSESAPSALPADFDREHVRLLTDKLSERAADLSASNSRFAALADLNLEIASERNVEALLELVCAGARNLVGSHFAVLAVEDESNKMSTYFTTSGIDGGPTTVAAPDLYAGPLGDVFSNRQPWRWQRDQADAQAAGFGDGYPAATAFLGVPLMAPTRVYGWLCLGGKVGAHGFDNDDERLLSTLGALAGRTYESIRLQGELRRQAAKLNRAYAILSGINALIVHQRNRQELCEEACRLIADTGQFKLAHIDRLERSSGDLALVAAAGEAIEVERLAPRTTRELVDRDDLSKMTLRGRISGVCNDLAHTELNVRKREEMMARGIRSLAAVPLGDGANFVGQLVLLADQEGFFDDAEMRLLSELASGVTLALSRGRDETTKVAHS